MERRYLQGNFQIDILVRDEAGNVNENNPSDFNFIIDGHFPALNAYIDDVEVTESYQTSFNGSKNLVINVQDNNFKEVKIETFSNSSNRNSISPYIINNTEFISNGNQYTYNFELSKKSDVNKENMTCKITAFDMTGNFNKIENINIIMSNDNEPPRIRIISEEIWRHYMRVSDDSIINKIYVKYIDLPTSGSVELENYTTPDTSWKILANNVISFKFRA